MCSACLTADEASRLGANGASEVSARRATVLHMYPALASAWYDGLCLQVMKHPWFSAVVWDAVAQVGAAGSLWNGHLPRRPHNADTALWCAQGRHPVPAWDRSLGEWLGPDDVLDPAVNADVFGDF